MSSETPNKDREKLLGYVELIGELSVEVASALWLPLRDYASVVFAIGVVVFVFGRFMQVPFYTNYSKIDPRELTLRRLYHQRVFGMVALIISAMLMHLPPGFYYGLWLPATGWLVPFILFAVTEVYTAFRISSVCKG